MAQTDVWIDTVERSHRRIRLWLFVFIVGLVLSGLTAIPLQSELDLLGWLMGLEDKANVEGSSMMTWIAKVRHGLRETNLHFPSWPTERTGWPLPTL
jgi:hypothetical protein